MKPSGVLLVIAGTWVLCQVLGGNALGRLNITSQSTSATTSTSGTGAHAQHALQDATQAVAQTKVQQAGQAVGSLFNQGLT